LTRLKRVCVARGAYLLRDEELGRETTTRIRREATDKNKRLEAEKKIQADAEPVGGSKPGVSVPRDPRNVEQDPFDALNY
jgi:hypothetical protein